MKVVRWMKEEFYSALPAIIFFFFAFGLADLSQMFLHKTTGSQYYSLFVVLGASLVMGKVVLLADHLSITGLFSKKPLIYATVWKTIVYFICSILVRFLEHAIPHVIEGGNWHASYESFCLRLEGVPFWVDQGWLFILILVFVSSRELIFAVGANTVRKLFFGP